MSVPPGLSPTQTHGTVATVRTVFAEFSRRVAAVVVLVSAQAKKGHAGRNCRIEVHLPDGHVEYVAERQRRGLVRNRDGPYGRSTCRSRAPDRKNAARGRR